MDDTNDQVPYLWAPSDAPTRPTSLHTFISVEAMTEWLYDHRFVWLDLLKDLERDKRNGWTNNWNRRWLPEMPPKFRAKVERELREFRKREEREFRALRRRAA